MLKREWLDRHFAASISQGLGEGIGASSHEELGVGVFAWSGLSSGRIFERGIEYRGHTGTCLIRFCDVKALTTLDLQELLLARRSPQREVKLIVETSGGTTELRATLPIYSALVGMLCAIVDPHEPSEESPRDHSPKTGA